MDTLAELMERHQDRVTAILNILVESPYFYASDDRDRDLFPFLIRHKNLFRKFFEHYYGWELIIDSGQKCARVYKHRWYNPAVKDSQKFALHLTRRDETLAFMLLLEFFEHQLDEQNVSVEDKDNLRFYFSDLFEHVRRRLLELYPEKREEYTEEGVRRILRELVPKLEQFRLLERVASADGERVKLEQMILEALPALYHYNGSRLSFPVFQQSETADEGEHADEADDRDETTELDEED
ncbi:DUF2398 family protein [bacterium]|nr:DUF2398 family protein [bacterium]